MFAIVMIGMLGAMWAVVIVLTATGRLQRREHKDDVREVIRANLVKGR